MSGTRISWVYDPPDAHASISFAMVITSEPEVILRLSDELVELQRPIRVLDAIAWGDDVAEEFFANGANDQPRVDASYYAQSRPLGFQPARVRGDLASLRTRVTKQLGGSPIGEMMVARVNAYFRLIDMLEARGTPAFTRISSELYGGTSDELHPDGPTLASLGVLLNDALENIDSGRWEPPEEQLYTAEEGREILTERLQSMCSPDQLQVVVDGEIVADAAAGSDRIKLRSGARFSERDLRQLEVHEGWVHVATTINGRMQPWCTFLEKGTPFTTATQEGLAVFSEITSMSSTPRRLHKVTRRMIAIGMVENGATFLDVYRWFIEEGLGPEDAWASSVRVFRGSTPTDGPFTKDLVYSRGFLEVYDFMRLAVRRGRLERLPLLFAGKVAVRELGTLAHLADVGLVVEPKILPPHLSDVSAIASWMAYSNLLNRIDLGQMELHLADALD